VHEVGRVEQGRGDRHGTEDARLAFLEGAEHQHASSEVDAIGRERQRSESRHPA
jgi:hypothetical protein